MTPTPRTPQQRDRRFARVRLVSRSIFFGSTAFSVLTVGYLSSITHLHSNVVVAPTTTTTTPAGVSGASGATGSTATTPTTAPTTTTTTCYTTPSGNTLCN